LQAITIFWLTFFWSDFFKGISLIKFKFLFEVRYIY